jgi:hypothetical protein
MSNTDETTPGLELAPRKPRPATPAECIAEKQADGEQAQRKVERLRDQA